jgi:dihydrofolate reductase
MIVSAIAAMSSNRVIGKDGGLPWRLPEDFKFFKDTTTGHIMVMGRKTFESLGKPLPKRLHVVISRRADYQPDGAHVFATVEEALAYAKSQTPTWGDEVFVIGGGEIYAAALPFTDRIYLTEIKAHFEGDAKFPEFDKKTYRERSRKPGREAVPYDFVVYERD